MLSKLTNPHAEIATTLLRCDKSNRPSHRHSTTQQTSCTLQRMTKMSKPDPTLALIAARFTRHDVEKSGKGYQIVDRRTANPIARLCPIPDTDRFELFYWSNTKGRWTTFGNFGRIA